MKTIRDAVLIIIAASALGLIANSSRLAISGTGLPLNTPWPDNRHPRQLEMPPSFQPGDSLLSLDDAYSLYLQGKAIFLDAREPEDYIAGHIKGAINMPFEQWDAYWSQVKPKLDPNYEIIAYCGGLDCELSLFLARELKRTGYQKSFIFFGGWQKWQEAGLPTEAHKND